MEWLNIIWNYVVPIGGGVTIGGLIIWILTALFKSWTDKFTKKIDLAAIEKKAVDEGVAKIKDISFTQTIQPVVESGLQKVLEKSQDYIKDALSETDKRYLQLIEIMQKFACYFDGAVGVSQQVKDEFHKAIDEAGIPTVEPTIITVVEPTAVEEKTAVEVTERPKTVEPEIER